MLVDEKQKLLDKITSLKTAHPEKSIKAICKELSFPLSNYYNWNKKGKTKKKRCKKVEVVTNYIPIVPESSNPQMKRGKTPDDIARFMGIMMRSFFQGSES